MNFLKEDYDYSQEDLDNHSRNMNPEDEQYWGSRGGAR